MGISLYREPSSGEYAVAKAIRQESYKIADWCGRRVRKPFANAIGILEPRQPALWIGTLWLWQETDDPSFPGSIPRTDYWTLEVYGKDNLPKLSELLSKLTVLPEVRYELQTDCVPVKIELASEYPKYETPRQNSFSEFFDKIYFVISQLSS